MSVAHDLTLQGHIVLAPCVFHHSDKEELTTEEKIRLDNLHKEKINMSDAIFVVNVDGYIGESTYGEIDWATRMKKQIFFLVEPPKPEQETEAPIEGSTEVDETNS
jgi:hypothetical protein